MDKATVTRRARNISFGWTNSVHQEWNKSYTHSSLVLDRPRPGHSGSLKSALAERDSARRGNNGNEWVGAWYVNGRQVVSIVTPDGLFESLSLGDALTEYASVQVALAPVPAA